MAELMDPNFQNPVEPLPLDPEIGVPTHGPDRPGARERRATAAPLRPARAEPRADPLRVFFLAPLLTLARFSLQNVPTILLGWTTLFDKWSLNGLTKAFDDPQFWPTLKLSLQLAVGTVVLTLACCCRRPSGRTCACPRPARSSSS